MDGAEARTREVTDMEGGVVRIQSTNEMALVREDYLGKAKLDNYGHLWIVLVGYMVDPRSLPNPLKLSADNVLHTSQPACYLCEKDYAEANHKPCTGDPSDNAGMLRMLGLID